MTSASRFASVMIQASPDPENRVMDLPPFPRLVEIPDLKRLVGCRLSQTLVVWPNQAVPLQGYMCHPNDEGARYKLIELLRNWDDHSGSKAAENRQSHFVIDGEAVSLHIDGRSDFNALHSSKQNDEVKAT